MNPANTSPPSTDGISDWSQQVQLTLKELRETLRDRRTIVTLLAMPILLYPLLGLGFRMIAVGQPANQAPVYRLALDSEDEARWLTDALQAGNQLLKAERTAPNDNDNAFEPEFQILIPDDLTTFGLEQMVGEGIADLGLRVRLERSPVSGEAPLADVDLLQRSGSAISREAADYVQTRLRKVAASAISQWARTKDASFQWPVRESIQWIESRDKSSAILGLLPLILLLMTVTGGVYPAIDLTAGERERETLETLMAMPVSRFRLLLAKYVAVVTVTLLTGLMNLVAMTVTVFALQLDSSLFGASSLTFSLAIKLCLVLIAFALFYSAVLLLLTSSARSFKEAQAYLIPLLLISLTPGLVILLPGWNLNRGTSVLPLVNMLLLARELFEGTATWLPMLAATISTLLYALAALSLAAQVFGADAVMVGSRGRWRDWLKRPHHVSIAPSLTTAAVALALLFPAFFVASGLLGRDPQASIGLRLSLSSLLTATLFVGVPIAVLRWKRVTLQSGLSVRGCSPWYFVGAVLLGLGTWPWVFELVAWLHELGIHAMDDAKVQLVSELLAAWKSVPLPVVIVCLGIVPGICEEIFFRGFLFSGVRSQFGGWGSVLLTAIAFGAFHIVLTGGAAPERLIPSTVMGLLLGWVAWKSGSVLPSALLHALHNSTLLAIVHFRDQLAGWNLGGGQQDHLPTAWLLAALAAMAIGIVLVRRAAIRPAADDVFEKTSPRLPREVSRPTAEQETPTR